MGFKEEQAEQEFASELLSIDILPNNYFNIIENNDEIKSALLKETLASKKIPLFKRFIADKLTQKEIDNGLLEGYENLPEHFANDTAADFISFSDFDDKVQKLETEFFRLWSTKQLNSKYYGNSIKETDTFKILHELKQELGRFDKYIFSNQDPKNDYNYSKDFAINWLSIVRRISIQPLRDEVVNDFVNENRNFEILARFGFEKEPIGEHLEFLNRFKTLKMYANVKLSNEIDSNGNKEDGFEPYIFFPLKTDWGTIAIQLRNGIKYQDADSLGNVFYSVFAQVEDKLGSYYELNSTIPYRTLNKLIIGFRKYFPKDKSRISGVSYYDDLLENLIFQFDPSKKPTLIPAEGSFKDIWRGRVDYLGIVFEGINNENSLRNLASYFHTRYLQQNLEEPMAPTLFLGGLRNVIHQFNANRQNQLNKRKEELFHLVRMRREKNKPTDEIVELIEKLDIKDYQLYPNQFTQGRFSHPVLHSTDIRYIESSITNTERMIGLIIDKSELEKNNFSSESEEKINISQKIREAFGFMLHKNPRNHRSILCEATDFDKLVDPLTFYFAKNYEIPKDVKPIENANINQTHLVYTFVKLFDDLGTGTRPDSLFNLLKAIFPKIDGEVSSLKKQTKRLDSYSDLTDPFY